MVSPQQADAGKKGRKVSSLLGLGAVAPAKHDNDYSNQGSFFFTTKSRGLNLNAYRVIKKTMRAKGRNTRLTTGSSRLAIPYFPIGKN